MAHGERAQHHNRRMTHEWHERKGMTGRRPGNLPYDGRPQSEKRITRRIERAQARDRLQRTLRSA